MSKDSTEIEIFTVLLFYEYKYIGRFSNLHYCASKYWDGTDIDKICKPSLSRYCAKLQNALEIPPQKANTRTERKLNPIQDQLYCKKSAGILKTSNQHLLFKFCRNIFSFIWKWRFIQIITFISFYYHCHHCKSYLWKIITIVSIAIDNIPYTLLYKKWSFALGIRHIYWRNP